MNMVFHSAPDGVDLTENSPMVTSLCQCLFIDYMFCRCGGTTHTEVMSTTIALACDLEVSQAKVVDGVKPKTNKEADALMEASMKPVQ